MCRTAFMPAWMAASVRRWCYWGAIRFAIRCGRVRSATGNEFLERRINTADFALLCIGADCCGALGMDFKSAASAIPPPGHGQ